MVINMDRKILLIGLLIALLIAPLAISLAPAIVPGTLPSNIFFAVSTGFGLFEDGGDPMPEDLIHPG